MTIVTEYLKARGVPYEEIKHERSAQATAEARVVGVDAGEVLKAVVLDSGPRHAIAVIPADRRLEMRLLREALHDAGRISRPRTSSRPTTPRSSSGGSRRSGRSSTRR